MANQVGLLELTELDNTKNGSLITHLEHGSWLHAQARQDPPRIVARNDPDDLLTWELPDPDQSKANGTNINDEAGGFATCDGYVGSRLR